MRASEHDASARYNKIHEITDDYGTRDTFKTAKDCEFH
jgi:hypothetical protein